MDRLEAMSILVAVAEAGSLSAAGRRLNLPLTTVSRKVAELEAHLGSRLLNRSTRRLALTEAGRTYVAACKRILEQVGEAERAVGGEYQAPKGELTVTAPIVFGRLHVLPVATEFLQAYPEVDIRLRLTDRLVHLLDDRIDLALRIGHLPDSLLVATRLGTIRRVVCASPGYLAARGTPGEPGDLAGHDCIAFDRTASPITWPFAADGAEVAVPIRSRLVVTTAEAAIDAAVAGLGLTRVLSYQAAAAVRAGTLALVLQDFEQAPLPVSLVHRGQLPLPLKSRAFLDFAAPRLKQRIAGVGLPPPN